MTTRHAIVPFLLALAMAVPASAQSADQQTFASADEATKALVGALKAGDNAKVLAILGFGADPVISSGDPVADKAEKDAFLASYAAKNSLVPGDADTMVLQVGLDEWPFPIPVVRRNGRWFFDGPAGAEEIVYRRIGRNELAAIDVCRGAVAAQEEYASEGRDGQPAGLYAQKLISDAGRHNGLYWPDSAGGKPSPAGPLLAKAAAESYTISAGTPTPYHGYVYRLLTAQGPAAPGGAKSYLVDGGMIGGFAFVAYPAEYRRSGVMTFMVGKDGVIYQKDLGPKTAELAKDIKEYNPDPSWTPLD
jgi:hypothetical protein